MSAMVVVLLAMCVGGGFAWIVMKKVGSKSMAFGGGFLVAFLALFPLSLLLPSANQEQAEKPNIGKTYDQLMVKMEDYFPDMQSSQLESGESRRMGTSDSQKAAAIYEIEVEPNKPATRVSMSFFAAKGGNSREENLQATLLNMGAMTVTGIMIQNVFPGWTDGPKIVMKGLLDLTKQQPENDQPSKSEITRDDKTIQLNFIKSLGMFVVTVAPRKI